MAIVCSAVDFQASVLLLGGEYGSMGLVEALRPRDHLIQRLALSHVALRSKIKTRATDVS